MVEYRSNNPIGFFNVDRPRCPKCHEPAMLRSKTEAGPPGFEYRIFACRKCGRIHTMIIASAPMESDVHGWLSGPIETADDGLGLLAKENIKENVEIKHVHR